MDFQSIIPGFLLLPPQTQTISSVQQNIRFHQLTAGALQRCATQVVSDIEFHIRNHYELILLCMFSVSAPEVNERHIDRTDDAFSDPTLSYCCAYQCPHKGRSSLTVCQEYIGLSSPISFHVSISFRSFATPPSSNQGKIFRIIPSSLAR